MDNSTHNNAENLVRYLDGELTNEEKAIVENQLRDDAVLQTEYNSLLATRASIRYYGLQQKVGGIHQTMMKEFQAPVRSINNRRKNIRTIIAVAASVLLLITGYVAYNFINLSAEKVYSSNYKPYELSTVRSGGSIEKSLLEESYAAKEYDKVVSTQFDRAFTIPELFLRAMSYLALDKNDKAIAEYKKVIGENETAKTSIFKQEAEYYLALTYIRNKEYSAALLLLHKIQDDPSHLYHEKVTNQLIRQVKMLNW
jgi:tetratricopeptide (TPR) repeat protein